MAVASSDYEFHPHLRARIAVVVGDLRESEPSIEVQGRVHASLAVQPERPESEGLRLLEAALEEPSPEPLALAAGTDPHPLDLAHARREPTHGRRSHDLSRGIL